MKTQTLSAETKSDLPRIRKILVPSDFSAASGNAFNSALRYGHEFGADLILLHVLESVSGFSVVGLPPLPAFPEEERSLAESSLRESIASARANGVSATFELRSGPPAHKIVEAAKEHDVDLVIIATHGHSSWKHFCIGSTAERVVRAAPCPVLVVREKEYDFV